MIGIIVHHFANAGMESDGRNAIETSGRAMKAFPGFKHRYTMVARDDPSQLSTVTLWESHDDFVRWTQSEVNRNIIRKPGSGGPSQSPSFSTSFRIDQWNNTLALPKAHPLNCTRIFRYATIPCKVLPV
jgi:heme-degrading monooxygenase HmoA